MHRELANYFLAAKQNLIVCLNYNLGNRSSTDGHLGYLDSLAVTKSVVGFPGGAVVNNPPANAGDMGLSPGLGRSHMPRSN